MNANPEISLEELWAKYIRELRHQSQLEEEARKQKCSRLSVVAIFGPLIYLKFLFRTRNDTFS